MSCCTSAISLAHAAAACSWTQSRQLRDDEDALNSMSEDYGDAGGNMSHHGGVGSALSAPRETAAEKRAREEAEYSWEPPSQTSQQRNQQLAAKLGY